MTTVYCAGSAPADSVAGWAVAAGYPSPIRLARPGYSRAALAADSGQIVAAPAPVAVVVTCHRDYLRYLPEALEGWSEAAAWRRVLVLDGVRTAELEGCRVAGWEVMESEAWGHPSPLRNQALRGLVHSRGIEWIHYWDADNVPPPGIVGSIVEAIDTAPPGAGYLGPFVREGLDPRDTWGVDTNGLWRVRALCAAGGWPRTWLEDWSLGCTLSRLGWTVHRWESGARRRSHPAQRSRSMRVQERVWSCRVWAIIGDRCAIRASVVELPPNVIWLDPFQTGMHEILKRAAPHLVAWWPTEARPGHDVFRRASAALLPGTPVAQTDLDGVTVWRGSAVPGLDRSAPPWK